MAIIRDPGEYEKEQIRAIDEWKKEQPGGINTALGFVMFPISVLIQAIVPRKAIRDVLRSASATAERLADEGDVMRKGEVLEIEVLSKKDLRLSDQLANEIHNWAIGIASAEGVGIGMCGPQAAQDRFIVTAEFILAGQLQGKDVCSSGKLCRNPTVFDQPSFLKGASCRPGHIVDEPGVDRPSDGSADYRNGLQDLSLGDIDPQLPS